MEEVEADEGEALERAAWEVYGAAPADFVATRTRWVKQLRSRKRREAARAVAALRKPSVSAAAVNALVRSGHPVTERLGDLGARLRHAQSALDVSGLTGLRGERDAVLQEWVAAAREHAPGPLTTAAEAEVRDTAVAALADEAATEVVLSGTLTRALSYSGFGEVDVSDAVARTATGVVLTRIEGGGGATDPGDEDGGQEDASPAAEQEDAAPEEDTSEDGEQKDVSPEEEVAEKPAPQEEAPKGAAAKDEGGPGPAALARLEEALAEAEDQVSAARSARRAAAGRTQTATARSETADEELSRARQLLARAEEEAERAAAAAEEARAELADADATLARARALRDEARAALEEAEDAG